MRLFTAVRSYPFASYFTLTFIITWTIWAPLVANAHGVRFPLLPYHHYLGALGPIIAAFIVTGIGGWRSGLSDLGARLFRWRVGLRWYGVALLGPFSIFLLASAILAVFGQTWPDLSAFGVSKEFPQLGFIPTFLLYTLTFGWGKRLVGEAMPYLVSRDITML